MNPADRIRDDYIEYLNHWSVQANLASSTRIRVRSGFFCDVDRPEPYVLWLNPKRFGLMRPTTSDVLLLIEASDYCVVAEYWAVDVKRGAPILCARCGV